MAPGSELARRGVQEDIASIPETLKSWDSCMAKSWCKYPVIAACVVGALVLVSIIWCCYRCCCRRRRRKAERSKSTFFNDPIPAYMTSGTTPTPNSDIGQSNYNSNSNSNSNANSSSRPSIGGGRPQFAYFESGSTGAKNGGSGDDLPVMPSWNNAKSEKVEDTSKVEVIELTEVDQNGRQQSPPKPASALSTGRTNLPPSAPLNRLPLAAEPSQYHHPQQNFAPPTNNNNMNPFGPQRLNSPFAPNSRVPIAPPTRIQSPYPENSNMPTAAPNNGGVAPSIDLDFDFNPHINAQNQGPYANADIYPPEPAYQPANAVHHQAPQYSGTTAPQPQPQSQQFTGTTSSVPPAPAGYAEAYSSPPRQQTHAHTVTINNANNNLNTNGFMAQMDDDYGHSPIQLTQPNGGNGHTNAVFNPNDFDHGGYGGGYNNNHEPSTHVADGFHNQYSRPAMPQNANGFNGQQQQQPHATAWSAF
ncbi:hypothetical protein ABW21_db0204777 [Orbilia brochopaga]|nr:hypothetical protein ABW21_db0204777 [Drechslerella brochopaga]